MGRNDEPQSIPVKGDGYVGPVSEQDTVRVHPKDVSSDYSGNGQSGGHGAPEYVGEHQNEILQQEAKSKDKWFSYVKTKQFWLVLLFGQGMCCIIRNQWILMR